ncbi:MAG TPA: hypothetical protein VGM92_04965 [Candidatus Kapabacteria bacterium]|jgi:hypothetical protein
MKNNVQASPSEAIPGFHAVDFFGAVKEKIARETEHMTIEEFKKYIADQLKKAKYKPISS